MAFDPTTAVEEKPAQPITFDPTSAKEAGSVDQVPISVEEAAKSHAPEMAKYFSGTNSLDSVFNGEQKLAFNKLAEYTPNDNESQVRAINQAFVKTQMPDVPESVIDNNWEAVKKGYAETRFGLTRDHVNDTEFHTNVSQTYDEINALKNPSGTPKPWDWKAKAAAIETLVPFAVKNFWDNFTTPLKKLPSAPQDLPNKFYFIPETTIGINPAVLAGVWNGMKPALDSMLSPAGITGLIATEGLGIMAEASPLAKAALVSIKGGFGLIAAKAGLDSGSKFNKLLKDPKASLQDTIAAGTETFINTSAALLSAFDIALDFFPKGKQAALVKEIEANPEKITDILKREEQATDIPGHAEAINNVRSEIESVQDVLPKEPPKLDDVVIEEPKVEDVPKEPAIAEPTQEAMAVEAEREPSVIGPEPTTVIDETKPGDTISIKNEVMDKEMENLGLDPAESGQKKTFEDLVNKQNEKFKSDPNIGQRLVEELNANPRAPSAEENVLLGIEARRLKNARNAAEEALIKARVEGNVDAEAAAQQQIDILRDQFAKTAATDKLAGTASGQSLAFRKVMLREDYSLAALERKLEVAKGKKLTPEETEQLRKTSKKLEENKRKLAEAEAKQRGELPSEESINKEYEAKKKKLEDEIQSLKAKIKGEVPVKKATQKPLTRPEVEEIEKLSQERDALKETLNTKVEGKTDVNAEAAMRKRIEMLDQKIKQKLSELQGEPQIVKGKLVNRPQPPEIEQRLQKLAEINKQIAEREKRTPEQILAARKQAKIKTYQTKAEKLKAKIEAGDVTREQRVASEMSPEVQRARAEYQKTKQEFDRKVYEAEQAKRTPTQKGLDLGVKIVRAGVLSRVGIIAKLTALVGERAFITPVRQAIKYAAGKALPDVARAARFEGIDSFGGLVRSEAKAFTALWTQGLPGALDILRGEQAPIEQVLGLENLPKDVLDYPTQLHKALHFPIQISDYVRRLSLINERDLRAGIDMSEPLNQLRNMQEAWEYSKRSVYLQDNKLVSGYQQMLKTWESTSKTGEFSPLAKTLAYGAKLENPIVKVPVNVATELTEHVAGLLDPAARFLFKQADGFKNLKAAEADMLMRHIANGSLGAFLGLYGWLKYKEIGGFYQEGDKRKPGDLKPGEIKVNGMVIPSTLLKENAFEIMNAGATFHKAFDAIYKKTGSIPEGAINGLSAVAVGIAEVTPFIPDIKQISAIMDPRQRNRAVATVIANALVPGFVQEAAVATDRPDFYNIFQSPTPRKEKEKTFGGALKKEFQLRIPGQRLKVPKTGSQQIQTFER